MITCEIFMCHLRSKCYNVKYEIFISCQSNKKKVTMLQLHFVNMHSYTLYFACVCLLLGRYDDVKFTAVTSAIHLCTASQTKMLQCNSNIS